jgi:hypothetical protein
LAQQLVVVLQALTIRIMGMVQVAIVVVAVVMAAVVVAMAKFARLYIAFVRTPRDCEPFPEVAVPGSAHLHRWT